LEPEAPLRARVLGRLHDDFLIVFGGPFLPVLRLLVGRDLVVLLLVELAGSVYLAGTGRNSAAASAVARVAVAVAVAVLSGRRAAGLLLAHQLGQGAGEGVDLVWVEFGAVAQLRRFLGEEALEAE